MKFKKKLGVLSLVIALLTLVFTILSLNKNPSLTQNTQGNNSPAIINKSGKVEIKQ